jgi:hypothetical protein
MMNPAESSLDFPSPPFMFVTRPMNPEAGLPTLTILPKIVEIILARKKCPVYIPRSI